MVRRVWKRRRHRAVIRLLSDAWNSRVLDLGGRGWRTLIDDPGQL